MSSSSSSSSSSRSSSGSSSSSSSSSGSSGEKYRPRLQQFLRLCGRRENKGGGRTKAAGEEENGWTRERKDGW